MKTKAWKVRAALVLARSGASELTLAGGMCRVSTWGCVAIVRLAAALVLALVALPLSAADVCRMYSADLISPNQPGMGYKDPWFSSVEGAYNRWDTVLSPNDPQQTKYTRTLKECGGATCHYELKGGNCGGPPCVFQQYIDFGTRACNVVDTVKTQKPDPGSCPDKGIGKKAFGNPIYPLTGAKKEFLSTGISLGGLEFLLVYDTTPKLPANIQNAALSLVEPNSFGALWRSNLHHKLQVAVGAKKALLSRGDGTILNFDGDGAGIFTGEANNPHKLVSISGGYRFTDVISGEQETFDSTGKLTAIDFARGGSLTFSYGDDLDKVQANDGRTVQFSYSNGLISKITGPDGAVIAPAYDASGNLASLTWPDNKALTFVYENASYPWALTGKVDENGSRYATFTYDSQGRAVSTEHSGGANRYSVSYAAAPSRVVTESFDAVNNVLYRTHSWQLPSGTMLTKPNGQEVSIEAADVAGMPGITSQSQPAGSGCSASTAVLTYDASGNVASRDDFTGHRTCFVYDVANRETVRVEGLANTVDCATVTPSGASLPPGARKITTSWHPDWRKPVQINEPLRRTSTVYHGQPDPFNNNIPANCTSASAMPNGKPTPLICKTVVQPLLANGSVDNAVAALTTSYSYDAAGRLLTATDANNRTTTNTYYSDTAFSEPSNANSSDANFDAVQLLLRGNGINGSTSFGDSSTYQKAFSAVGNAQISTTQAKFGGGSIALDGSGDFVRTANSPRFDLGSSDYTVEAFVWLVAAPASGSYFTIASNLSDSPQGGWRMLIGTDRKLLSTNAYWSGSGPTVVQSAQQAIPLNTWVHVAMTRNGTSLKTWVNGVLDSEVTTASAIKSSTAPLDIGANTGSTWFFNGYIDELRVTKGKARYTANFTPPTQEFPNSGPDIRGTTGHRAGDLLSVTNVAGQVTQYTLYDPAGRVRQTIDPKGVVTDITYTPRGWVSIVTVTPPGSAARTTSYSYDGVGQLTQVSQPDGTTLSYSYDTAHRLVGVTDAQGNSVSYTLDAAGNRIGEEVRDGSGSLQRSIARSFDALSRLQQVTGAAR